MRPSLLSAEAGTYIGTYNEKAQKLVNPINEAQLLDAGWRARSVYASKSFYDPVHRQQVWTAWVVEPWTVDGGCANATVCGTHTLPRSLMYDPALKQLVTPPIPQLSLLRSKQLLKLGRQHIRDGELFT